MSILAEDNITITSQKTVGDNAAAYTDAAVEGLVPMTGHAEGAIANFEDLLIKDLTADINPVQDLSGGNPSPTNICPISGFAEAKISRTSTNLCDEVFEAGGLNGVSGLPATIANRVRTKNFNPCKGGESYYIYCGTEVALRVFWYDITKTFISRTGNVRNEVVTAPSNAYYFKLNTEGTAYGETYRNDISMNYPSTDTSYHAYTGTVYTIDLGRTVYKGTLDVTTGLLTVDKIKISQTWGNFTNSTTLTNYVRRRYDFSTGLYKSSAVATSISNVAPYATGYSSDTLHFYIDTTVTTTTRAWVYLPTGTSDSTTIEIVYPLDTPLTYQLTPTQIATLNGTNNIWSDTGNVYVDLVAIRDDSEKLEKVSKLAGDTAQNFWFTGTGTDTGAHITEVSQEEWNDSTSPNYHKGGNLLARSNGIAVRDGLTELSSFGSSGTNIGRTDSCHLEITPNSMTLLDAEGRKQMTANLLNDQSTGLAVINYTVRDPYTDGTTTTFTVAFLINEILECYDVTTGDPVAVTKTGDREITFAVAPQVGSVTRVRYNTLDPVYDFGLGTRTDGVIRGSDSIVIGNDNEASSYLCIAIGAKNKVNSNQAIGIGRHIIASSHDQIAMGRWNVEDSQNRYGFIFGNGTADNARSNALAIAWNGDIHLGRAGALFTVSEETTAALTISGSTNLSSQTLSISKAGYVPLGIVGVRCNYTSGQTGARNVYQYSLSSRTAGAGTVSYSVRNLDSASTKGTITFEILWVRADAV